MLTNSVWQGSYYNSVPVILTAIVSPGYVFSHWLGHSDSSRSSISLNFDEDVLIEAVFIALSQ